MAWRDDDRSLSELEKELELEFEEPSEEFEEPEGEFEEPSEEFEEPAEDREEPEGEAGDVEHRISDYADRFFELQGESFESEMELDDRVNRLLGEIDQDFFFKKLKKYAKKGLRLANSPLFQKALRIASKAGLPGTQVLGSLAALARGDTRGLLSSLAKGALASAIPGAGLALPAIKALGFEASQDAVEGKEAWRNFVGFADEVYDQLVQRLEPSVVNPAGAASVATMSFNTALNRRRAPGWKPSLGSGAKPRRVTLARGQRLVVTVV